MQPEREIKQSVTLQGKGHIDLEVLTVAIHKCTQASQLAVN